MPQDLAPWESMVGEELCTLCEDEEVELTTTHLLTECAGLARTRLCILGKPFLTDIKEIGATNVSKISRFISGSKIQHLLTTHTEQMRSNNQ